MGYFILIVLAYFIPAMVAYHGKKKNRSAILLLNVLLGWTILGWIFALIWASMKD